MDNKKSARLTPRKWIANFWYYYKWLFLTALIFVIFVTICVVQYAASTPADLTLLYAGPQGVSEADCSSMVRKAEELLLNNETNEAITVALKTVQISADFSNLPQGQLNKAREAARRLQNEIVGGDAQILLLSREVFDELSESGALLNLYAVFSELPSGFLNDYGVLLTHTRLSGLEGFISLPRDTVLCVKAPSAALQDEVDTDRDFAITSRAFHAFVGR